MLSIETWDIRPKILKACYLGAVPIKVFFTYRGQWLLVIKVCHSSDRVKLYIRQTCITRLVILAVLIYDCVGSVGMAPLVSCNV